ncbi:VOC family protein [Kribbella catacumbae]|uniref:VOC family protein n=1 Tax=Kribbella catacumbae TaxID=460086 RepID=UPI0003790741|nr:VOC family protein [Kribbella catacumbae]
MNPTIRAGRNIAMKLPKAQYDATVAFYRDVLGFEITEESGGTVDGYVSEVASMQFGPVKIWFDRVDNLARSDLWLELFTDDVEAATAHLAEHGIHPQDELEPFPAGMRAHWISSPANVTHILRTPDPS